MRKTATNWTIAVVSMLFLIAVTLFAVERTGWRRDQSDEGRHGGAADTEHHEDGSH